MDSVIDFFTKKMNLNLDENSNVNKLGFSGLDAEILMSDFFDEFDIENSCDFEIYFFFVEELDLFDSLRKSYKSRLKEKKDLKISHLIDVVKKGVWFDL